MAIFNSYVSSPEGNKFYNPSMGHKVPLQVELRPQVPPHNAPSRLMVVLAP